MRPILPVLAVAAGLSLTACQPDAGEFDPPPPSSLEEILDEATAGCAQMGTCDQIAGGAAHRRAFTPQLSLGPLPDFFDCVRENGGMLIASHRGGPAPGYPENAIETLQYGLEQGLLVH